MKEQKIIESLIKWHNKEPENIQVLSDLFGMCVHVEQDDFSYSHKLNKIVRNRAAKMAIDNNSIQHLDLYKKSLLFDAPHELDAYLQYVEFDREPESRFYLPRRKQLFQVVQALQGLIDDDLDLVTVSMPPGSGKLLADDTPVLTTEGWKKHGDLKVGDKVFNHLGQTVKVTHIFPKNYAEYEITFANNEKILAHGDHEWVLYDKTIVETKELLNINLSHKKLRLIPSINPITKEKEQVQILKTKRVEPKRGNCIEVAGGIYLVGETMIPTHNSTLGIFFLSWVMGKYPMQPNLASAHSAKLTRSFYDGVLEILTDPEYLYADVFPTNDIVSTSAKDETIDLNRKKRFKTLTCRSIDGTLTGATRCEKILYADDLVSGIEEALSIDRLDSLWFKYTNDLKSRKKEGCKEVHIATRWSVHDPIGRLEQEYINSDRAKFIVLPALDENDKSNFNYPYGVGFSTQYFHDMRNNLDDVSWRALYMNQPIEREGLVFPEDTLNRYYELPRSEPDAILGVCDTAEGGGDSVCLPVAYVYGNEVYIEDVVFNKSLPDVTKPLCIKILMKHNVQQCRFESNNAGGGFADDIENELEKLGGITHITKKRTTQNKLTRIITNSDYIKKYFYFKDKSKYEPNSEYGQYMRELTSFTHAGKNKHDKMVHCRV